MSELLGDKLIYEALLIRQADIKSGADYDAEDAAIEALYRFELEATEILRLKDKLANAVMFILNESVDQQG